MSQDEAPRFLYPIKSNVEFVNESAIALYLDKLFGGVEWNDNRWLCIRGIGEKGTPKEGQFREDIFIQPNREKLLPRVVELAKRWAQYHVATFVVPCVLKAARGKAENVELFTNVLCDLDSGDTNAKLSWLYESAGEPSMVIASGGTTEAGTPKRHVYYCLEQPSADVGLVVKLRDMIARKVAADPTMGLGVESNPYGRAHQPVRISGTCHAKGGNAKGCHFEHSGPPVPLQRVIDGVTAMTFAPWVDGELAAKGSAKIKQLDQGGIFSPTSGRDIGAALNETVYEGSEDPDRNRWTAFNRSAGHFIRQARAGRMSVEEAKDATFGWVSAQMVPPWPDHRVDSEFNKLLMKDSAQNGVMPDFLPQPPPAPVIAAPPAPAAPPPWQRPTIAPPTSILTAWAAHRWVTEPKPKHQFLVDKLVIKGEPHLFVAEGGSGKTFLVSDLARKVASYIIGDETTWCGQKIQQGGTVVLILCEDSQREMHIRLLEIDKGEGLIERAGDKLIVLPMTSVGGAFPLVARDSKLGLTTSSPKWNELLLEMKKIPDLALVAIDTFNSVAHGDENSANVIAEMMREAHRVCGELGAALVFNHHIRKEKESIRSLGELSQSIRGSTAIPSYFRVCMGMFHAGDYDRRMRAMNLRPEKSTLWRFGIAKCNINGLMKGERTLLRNSTGLLDDVTNRDKFNMANMAEREAWLVFAIKQAALAGHPYTTGNKNAKGGIYARRSELPPLLRKMGDYEFRLLTEDGLQSEKITQCAIKGSKAKAYFDVIDGPLATDSFGGEVNAGAYIPNVDWEEYAYHKIEGMVMLKKDIHTPFSMAPAVSVV